MTRVKRSVHAQKKRRKVLEQAKGYWGWKHSHYRYAKEQVEHSLVYAYRDRKNKKRTFRRLWITRINAGARAACALRLPARRPAARRAARHARALASRRSGERRHAAALGGCVRRGSGALGRLRRPDRPEGAPRLDGSAVRGAAGRLRRAGRNARRTRPAQRDAAPGARARRRDRLRAGR